MIRLVSLLKLLLLLVALSFLEADDNCQPVSQAVNDECDVVGYDCAKPENDKMTEFKCSAGYRAEVKMDRRGNNWFHAEWDYKEDNFIVCNGDQWKLNKWKNADGTFQDGRVIGIRCTRKKVVPDVSSCEPYEDCKEPIISYPTPDSVEIKCDATPPTDASQAYMLQQKKVEVTHQWEKSADLTPEERFKKVVVKEKSERIKYRCARLKCYFTCNNNVCTGMQCDNNRFVMSRDDPSFPKDHAGNPFLHCLEKKTEGVSKWKTNTGLERELSDNSICDGLCSAVTPMKSICIDGYRLCEKVEFNDHAPAKCNGTIKYTGPNSEAPVIGTQFQCDKNTGKWWLKLMNNEHHELKSGGNVVCIHDDCDESKLFPNCEEGENCKQVIRNRDRFECPKSTSVWTRPNATADWEKHMGTDFLMCKRGEMLENGQEPLVAGAQLKCKSQCSWSTNYILMGVICLLAIR